MNYRNASLQCTVTIHQAVLLGARGIRDEAATAVALASEIAGVKEAVGKPVEVVDDAGSVYVDLRELELWLDLTDRVSMADGAYSRAPTLGLGSR